MPVRVSLPRLLGQRLESHGQDPHNTLCSGTELPNCLDLVTMLYPPKILSPGQNIALPCRAFRPNYILYLSLFYRNSVRVHNSRSVCCSPYQGMEGLESKVPHNTLCLCSGAELLNCLALLQEYRLWGKTSPSPTGQTTSYICLGGRTLPSLIEYL